MTSPLEPALREVAALYDDDDDDALAARRVQLNEERLLYPTLTTVRALASRTALELVTQITNTPRARRTPDSFLRMFPVSIPERVEGTLKHVYAIVTQPGSELATTKLGVLKPDDVKEMRDSEQGLGKGLAFWVLYLLTPLEHYDDSGTWSQIEHVSGSVLQTHARVLSAGGTDALFPRAVHAFARWAAVYEFFEKDTLNMDILTALVGEEALRALHIHSKTVGDNKYTVFDKRGGAMLAPVGCGLLLHLAATDFAPRDFDAITACTEAEMVEPFTTVVGVTGAPGRAAFVVQRLNDRECIVATLDNMRLLAEVMPTAAALAWVATQHDGHTLHRTGCRAAWSHEQDVAAYRSSQLYLTNLPITDASSISEGALYAAVDLLNLSMFHVRQLQNARDHEGLSRMFKYAHQVSLLNPDMHPPLRWTSHTTVAWGDDTRDNATVLRAYVDTLRAVVVEANHVDVSSDSNSNSAFAFDGGAGAGAGAGGDPDADLGWDNSSSFGPDSNAAPEAEGESVGAGTGTGAGAGAGAGVGAVVDDADMPVASRVAGGKRGRALSVDASNAAREEDDGIKASNGLAVENIAGANAVLKHVTFEDARRPRLGEAPWEGAGDAESKHAAGAEEEVEKTDEARLGELQTTFDAMLGGRWGEKIIGQARAAFKKGDDTTDDHMERLLRAVFFNPTTQTHTQLRQRLLRLHKQVDNLTDDAAKTSVSKFVSGVLKKVGARRADG